MAYLFSHGDVVSLPAYATVWQYDEDGNEYDIEPEINWVDGQLRVIHDDLQEDSGTLYVNTDSGGEVELEFDEYVVVNSFEILYTRRELNRAVEEAINKHDVLHALGV